MPCLTPQPFIEVPVPARKEDDHVFVLWLSFLSRFLRYVDWTLEMFRERIVILILSTRK